jgi:hypothetical protein
MFQVCKSHPCNAELIRLGLDLSIKKHFKINMYVALVDLVAHFQLYIIFCIVFLLTFSRVVLKTELPDLPELPNPPFPPRLRRARGDRTGEIGDLPVGLLPIGLPADELISKIYPRRSLEPPFSRPAMMPCRTLQSSRRGSRPVGVSVAGFNCWPWNRRPECGRSA